MTRDRKITDLKNTDIFANCSRDQLEAIARVTERVTVPEGRILLTEGHVGHDMYVLTTGSAEIRVGDELVATARPGDVVGELGVVDGKRCSATVTAGPDFEGWLVPRRGFAPLLDQDPSLARPLLDAVIAKLRATDKKLH